MTHSVEKIAQGHLVLGELDKKEMLEEVDPDLGIKYYRGFILNSEGMITHTVYHGKKERNTIDPTPHLDFLVDGGAADIKVFEGAFEMERKGDIFTVVPLIDGAPVTASDIIHYHVSSHAHGTADRNKLNMGLLSESIPEEVVDGLMSFRRQVATGKIQPDRPESGESASRQT